MESGGQASARILYDRDCGFCRWALDKILLWDRRGGLEALEVQSPEAQRILADAGIPEPARLESWHLVLPSGAVRSAGAGAAPLAELLPAGRPLAALFRRFPGATEHGYRWVADNRDRLARLLRIDATCEIRAGGGAPR